MKRVLKLSIIAVIQFNLALVSCNSGVRDGSYTLEIYSTNDIHGRIFDSLYTENRSNPYSLSSVSAIVSDARERLGEDGVILLDAGDFLQGDNSVYYYNYVDTVSEHIFTQVVSYLNYDALAVGNHDIETGHRVYDRIVRELTVPYLAANSVDQHGGDPYFDTYSIIARNGVKIAVIGLTNPNVKKWISEDLYSGIDFKEALPLVDSLVRIVRKREKPHFVIGLFHLGLGEESVYDPENCSKYIASHTSGIDLIFAAHDHKKFAGFLKNGNDSTALLEAGGRASALSLATVTLEFKNGRVISKNIKPVVINLEESSSDGKYNTHFRKEFLSVRDFTKQDIGEIKRALTSDSLLDGPTEYVDMLHSLQLEIGKADVSFAAPLNPSLNIPEGVIDFQDLMNIYPFENQLYILNLSGREIKDYLEYSYDQWINQTGMKYNYDSAAGLIYEVSTDARKGERIRIKGMAGGQPFNPDHIYKVAMTSYRANGGGDLLIKGAGLNPAELDGRVIKRGDDIRSLLHKKILERGELTPEKLNHWKFVQ
ncbi:MAG: bifunctional UDP-sugar hydrolase/5'-nucleotidase [Bacteroidales bacterium]|nr:bifunctional UDP-sugar hydrolase/5'-nucleotidase [Bacteroidales bacterium]